MCSSDLRQVDNKMMNYRTFDVEEYKKIIQKNDRGKRYIIRDSGMIVEKEEDFSNGNFIGFREDCHYPDSPYNTVFLYYKNGRIKKSWTTFYYCVIGNITEYDSIGRVVNQRDEDIFYKLEQHGSAEFYRAVFEIENPYGRHAAFYGEDLQFFLLAHKGRHTVYFECRLSGGRAVGRRNRSFVR